MTDKELLEFCKEHDVELSIRYDDDRDCYHLKLRKATWWIEHILSMICIDDAKSWRIIVKSILSEPEKQGYFTALCKDWERGAGNGEETGGHNNGRSAGADKRSCAGNGFYDLIDGMDGKSGQLNAKRNQPTMAGLQTNREYGAEGYGTEGPGGIDPTGGGRLPQFLCKLRIGLHNAKWIVPNKITPVKAKKRTLTGVILFGVL